MFPFQIQFLLPESESAGIPVNIGIVNLMNNKEFNEEDDATRSDYAHSEDGCWMLEFVFSVGYNIPILKSPSGSDNFPCPSPTVPANLVIIPAQDRFLCLFINEKIEI